MFLADTNVISAAAPRRGSEDAAARLAAWLAREGDSVWLSAVTVAELAFGAADLVRRRQARRAQQLDAWIEALVARHADRVLPVDAATARRAGVLLARGVAAGRAPGMEDALIGATAERHGLMLLTRNVVDFEAMGVATLDPFVALPG